MMEDYTAESRLSHSEILKLKRWNTPTVYNGWEQITSHDITKHFNKEAVTDFMPYMGPMVGYAVTVQFEPSNKEHTKNNKAWEEYRRYVAGVPGPKIVVVEDLDKPECIGAFWGEVNSNAHRALGCVGTITDGAIRDVDEMMNAGFKAIARRMCVGHAYSTPVRWNCEVEVFGCRISPGQLLHADKHGFLAVPQEDEKLLLSASRFMDDNECDFVIPAGRGSAGKSAGEILQALLDAGAGFNEALKALYSGNGEW